MRILVFVALLPGCDDPEPEVDVDAGVPADAFDVPPGSNYGTCYSWQEISPTLTKCAPKCWNYGTVGKYAINKADSCAIADEVYCDPKFMTAPAWHTGVGCCIYSSTPSERVDFLPCL